MTVFESQQALALNFWQSCGIFHCTPTHIQIFKGLHFATFNTLIDTTVNRYKLSEFNLRERNDRHRCLRN